jgi:hypothetical protein
MIRMWMTLVALALLAAPALAESEPEGGDTVVSGMSIVGNDEAPKSLVIVPWKTSELGSTRVVSKALDDSRGPVDRSVFERALRYYQIRSAGPAANR